MTIVIKNRLRIGNILLMLLKLKKKREKFIVIYIILISQSNPLIYKHKYMYFLYYLYQISSMLRYVNCCCYFLYVCIAFPYDTELRANKGERKKKHNTHKVGIIYGVILFGIVSTSLVFLFSSCLVWWKNYVELNSLRLNTFHWQYFCGKFGGILVFVIWIIIIRRVKFMLKSIQFCFDVCVNWNLYMRF